MGKIRVLSGLSKGRFLYSLPIDDLSVRPILARIKKSLFDILQNRISGTQFLDLYAGTGAVGIEALSRGAKFVVFVEKDKRSAEVINRNLKHCYFSDVARVERTNAITGLNGIGGPFDHVFLGPPYKDENKNMLSLTGPTLGSIVKAKILKKDGWIIAQHHETEKISVPDELTCFREKVYGDTIVSFYSLKES